MKLCNESCSVHPVKLYLNILIWFEIVESSKHKLEKKKTGGTNYTIMEY